MDTTYWNELDGKDGTFGYDSTKTWVDSEDGSMFIADWISDYSIIKTGLPETAGVFIKFNNKLYYMCGTKYIEYDGTTASEVVPYIPTVIINRTPTGGGDVLENYNRIGAGFTNKFNGDNSSVAYTLTDALLDATEVTGTVGTVAVTEDTDFTVDRTTGIVTFAVAPALGTDNVIITAHKTDQDAIDSVLECKIAIPFGGQNDNRLFVGGNGTGYFYWTAISTNGIDATYFAYNNYNVIGNSDENITAFGNHYETLTIHKESGEIFGETYTWNGTVGVFNTFPINPNMGCDCPNTIQSINNNLVWLNTKYGVCILVGTTIGSQRNVFPISRNINPQLMALTSLETASSIDYNGKYWLCIGEDVYLWDYFISPYYDTGNPDENAKRLSWWYFDNINALKFLTDGQALYYADRTTAKFASFHTTYDSGQFYDFGEAISATYRYPIREMGNGVYEFSLLKGWVNVRGDTRATITVTYFTSDDPWGDPSTENIEVGSFSWTNFNWSLFTWGVMDSVYQWALSPYEKNIRHFGAEFTNAEAGKDMNISSVIWQYSIKKIIK